NPYFCRKSLHMVAIAAQKVLASPAKSPKKISWEEFQRKYLSREDRYKYEWVNGQVEKTLRSMDKSQIFILTNLIRFLYALKSINRRIDGDLVAEGDTFFAGNHRRPDIAYYTESQIQAARRNEDVHPDFVIEVISKNDQAEKLVEKMNNYLAAGVKVIWQIYPQNQQIHVYHGKQIAVCTGDDLCSAEPVVEGFVLAVKDVFK
ncbi:MAG TPA: Uma2 family endonuclease, partial [Saprospiraceae bacterium]|nr:Uma2 family endonuclease [Saprospiraceae bacterium]